MKFDVFLALFALCVSSTIGWAQSSMSLSQAVEYATHNNVDIKKQNLAIIQSRQKIDELRGQNRPQIDGSVQVTDNLILPKTLIPGEIIGMPGTQLGVTFGVQYGIPISVSASQLLYSKAYKVGLEQAQAAVNLAINMDEKTRQDVMYNVASTYIQAIIVRQQSDLLKSNLDRIGESVKMIRSQYENQMARKIDLDQLVVSYANTETDYSNALISFDYIMDNLKILMGYPIGDTLVLAESIDQVSGFMPDNGVAKNPKLTLLQNQLELKNLEIKGIKAAYLPTVAAFAAMGLQTQFNTLDEINTFPNVAIGVKMSVPIYDGSVKKHQIEQRKTQLESLQLDHNNLVNALNVQYVNANKKYFQNLKNVRNQDENLKLAESVFTAVQNNYQNGLASLADFLNSSVGLKNAQTQFLTSQLQLKISQLDILYVNGDMSSILK